MDSAVAGCGTPITRIVGCCGLAGSGYRKWSSHDVATTAATVPMRVPGRDSTVSVSVSFQGGEQVCARLGNPALGRGHAGKCRPTAFLDVGILHPRADLVQLGHVQGDILGLSEPISAHWRKNRHKSAVCTFLSHLFRSAFQRPPAPIEADDHRREKTDDGSLQESRWRFSLKDLR